MNLREGKIGRQEGASLMGVAVLALLLFVTDGGVQYRAGNVSYGAYLFAGAFSLLLFMMVKQAMAHDSRADLAAFLEGGLGRVIAVPAGLLLAACLLLLAAALPDSFIAVLRQRVYPHAGRELLCLYFFLPAAALAYFGFETLGRCARLLFWLFPVSLAAALIMAGSHYAVERLAPYAVLDWPRTLYGASAAVPLLLLPGVACLATAKGQHGCSFAGKNGRLALPLAVLAAVIAQVFLGMRFPYTTLANMEFPLYMLTMQLETGGSFMRPDLLLLFVWLLFAVLSAGYLLYAAALLLSRLFHMGDIRPAIAGVTGAAMALQLRGMPWSASETVLQYAGLLTTAVLLLCTVLLYARGRRKERA